MNNNSRAQRERRERAKAGGLCIQCCKRPAKLGVTRCAPCGEDNAVRNRGIKRGTRVDQRAPLYTEFCLECIASGGYHRVGCVARKEAA